MVIEYNKDLKKTNLGYSKFKKPTLLGINMQSKVENGNKTVVFAQWET